MIKTTLARFKARQARGGSWVQLVLNIGIITANIKLFQSWFESWGISLTTALIIAVFGYVFGTICIGSLDERFLWQEEMEYNSTINPFMRGIKEQLTELCNR